MKRYAVGGITVTPDITDYKEAAAKRVGIKKSDIKGVKLIKKSVDARHGFRYVLTLAVETEKALAYPEYAEKADIFDITEKVGEIPGKRPVVAGSGPAGLFAALYLTAAGLKPIILERGGDVDARLGAVKDFWEHGKLNENCNVQFGAGGAGTFSDGKLNTGLNDPLIYSVLDIFYRFGAPEDILYSAAPHIGTDNLRKIMRSFLSFLERAGADVRFDTTMKDIVVYNGIVKGVICESGGKEYRLDCDVLIYACGQSAEDTIAAVYRRGAKMESKPFSMGVRIEHLRKSIDRALYGEACDRWGVGSASYKLSTHEYERGVYTFCMCPGGVVVPACSSDGRLVVNGMSYSARNGENSNSAILVEVRPSDYGGEHPLSGLKFREKWERKAFAVFGNNIAPSQNVVDFIKGVQSKRFDVEPSYAIGVRAHMLTDILPGYVAEGIRIGLKEFGKKIKGFDESGVLTGIESRSSSPVRIIRNSCRQSNLSGLYPCGEGAGYAGGITSAAVDGIKTAQEVVKRYR